VQVSDLRKFNWLTRPNNLQPSLSLFDSHHHLQVRHSLLRSWDAGLTSTSLRSENSEAPLSLPRCRLLVVFIDLLSQHNQLNTWRHRSFGIITNVWTWHNGIRWHFEQKPDWTRPVNNPRASLSLNFYSSYQTGGYW